MAHYIDKDALVAEIEGLKSAAETMLAGKTDLSYWKAQKFVSERLLSFLDTLEVKEVDLENIIDTYINNHYSEGCDRGMISDANRDIGGVTYFDLMSIARHFFELGLKAQKGE